MKNINLLYRMADTQNAYFTFLFPILRAIDLPSIPVTDEFYVIFYDRGSMFIGMELENATGNSYLYDSLYSELLPVEFTDAEQYHHQHKLADQSSGRVKGLNVRRMNCSWQMICQTAMKLFKIFIWA